MDSGNESLASGPHDQDGSKTPSNIFFSGTNGPISMTINKVTNFLLIFPNISLKVSESV